MIKLISVNNDRLKQEVLDIYIGNDYYFNKMSDNPPSISNVEKDTEAIPNGVQKNQKNYRLISFNDEILGVVDYLTDYPEKNTILIGFFIIKNDKQKQGFGTKIFRYLENLFKNNTELEKKMGNISFTQGIYNSSDSFLHKLDPRSKIIGSLMLIISVLSGSFFSFESSFKGYFLISVFLFAEMIISKISFTGIIKKIKIYLGMGFILMIFNIFFMKSGLLLLDLKILKIYDTPVLISMNVMCQIFLLTLIVEIFTSTTSTNEIMKGLNYLTGKKGKNTEMSLVYTFSVYFLPIVYEEFRKIIKIQKSRGNFSKISVRNFKEFFLIIVPLFRLTIEKVNRTAEIMTVKNFIINGEIVEYNKLKWSVKDTIYIGVVIFFVIFYIFLFYF